MGSVRTPRDKSITDLKAQRKWPGTANMTFNLAKTCHVVNAAPRPIEKQLGTLVSITRVIKLGTPAASSIAERTGSTGV